MPLDYPAQDYFPGAKVRLVVRLEEFGADDVRAQLPKDAKGTLSPSRLVKGSSTVRTTLTTLRTQGPYGAVYNIRQKEKATPAQRLEQFFQGMATAGAGTQQESSADERTVSIAAIIPKKASLKLNGIRVADKLDLTLRWIDFPIDPRAVRSVAVQYYLGTVAAEDFAAGVRGVVRGDTDPESSNPKEPLNLVPDTYSVLGVPRTNLRFEGWVDDWELDWSDGEPTIKLECRDNTQLLADLKLGAATGLNVKNPIDVAIADMLCQFPQMEGFSVEFRPAPGTPNTKAVPGGEATPPALGKLVQVAAVVPGVGPPQAKTGASDDGQSMLDYITDNVGSMGFSVRVEGRKIIVEEVRSYIDRVRDDDPYEARELPSGRYPVRAMIYGRNILELKMKRNFTRKAPQNVEARSYSAELKTTRVGQWPPREKRAASPNPGDGHAEDKWREIKLPGGLDEKTLERIARNYYESAFRQELGVHLKTRNLASFGAGNADPDLLDMRTGDSVDVLVDKGNSTSTTTDVAARVRVAHDFLVAQGYPKKFAAKYAEVVSNAGLQHTFIAREIGLDWDTEDGVTVEMDAVNYVTVRADAGAT